MEDSTFQAEKEKMLRGELYYAFIPGLVAARLVTA